MARCTSTTSSRGASPLSAPCLRPTPGPTDQATWSSGYDADGNRRSQLYTPYQNGVAGTAVVISYFMRGLYAMTGADVKKYYPIAGMPIAVNDGSGLKYLISDHLP